MKTTILFAVFLLGCLNSSGQQKKDALNTGLQLNLGINFIKDGNSQKGIDALNSIDKKSIEDFTVHKKGLLNFYLAEGFYELNQKGISFNHYESALAEFIKSKDSLMMGNCYFNLSYEQLIRGQYQKSFENIKLANLSFTSSKDSIGIIKSLWWTSIIYHDTQEYELGIEYGIRAYNVAKLYRSENADLKARTINAIAISYDDSGNFEKAIEYHLKVISLKNELSDTTKLAPTYNNIGNTLMKKGDYQEATIFFLKNLEINKIDNNKYGLATVYTNLGTVAYLNKQWKDAAYYLNKAEKISFEIKDAEKIQDILYQQFEHHKAANKLPFAIKYLTQYHNLKDSLLNIEKLSAIHELETQYETKEKELEIIQKSKTIETQKLLLQRNTIIIIGLILFTALLVLLGYLYKNRLNKQQLLALRQKEIEFKEAQLNAIIATQEKERIRFATDLHDSFGQTISVLKMNIKTAQNTFSQSVEAKKLYTESSKMLSEMYDELRGVCFNLMPTTLIKIGLVDAISEFTYRVNTAGKIEIEVTNFGLDKRLEELSEISIYRIVQEWINNILKYSDTQSVIIQFTTDKHEVTLTIEDTGTGFDTTMLESSRGNGWKNINARVKLLGGTVEVDSTKGANGTILILNAPLNYAQNSKT